MIWSNGPFAVKLIQIQPFPDQNDTFPLSAELILIIFILPPVLRWVPSVYGYHQVDALSRYCADSPILCVGKSNRGKDKSPSREKKPPSNTPLDEPRKFFGFVGLSSMFSRFFMENGESLAGWRVSCASESAITVYCPMWITIKTYQGEENT